MSDDAATTRSLPKYRELHETTLAGARHAWDVFGRSDELGRLNLLSPAGVLAAIAEVRRGDVVNLCLPLDLPQPPWGSDRQPYVHHIYEIDRNSKDDFLDSFYLQRSTQWDGFRHIRAAALGFYGGVDADGAGFDGLRLGIQSWAERGIVGRGVLVDMPRQFVREGGRLDPRVGTPIMVEDLQHALSSEGVTLRRGDILMVRTGYLKAYLSATADEREGFSEQIDCPGLYAGEEMAEFLWDSGVAAVVADNPAVEVVPGSKAAGSLHRRLIPLLGFPLGEFFALDRLGDACEADGVYSCLFVAAPLNLPGGVGSPGNAVAIR